jgi:GAF domain-containing protein/HAMP domain-containing protein
MLRNDQVPAFDNQEKYARGAVTTLRIALLACIVAVIYYLGLAKFQNEPRFLILAGATFALLLGALRGFFLARGGRWQSGSWALIISADITFLVPSLIFKNSGILFAPAIIALVALFALQALPQREARLKAIFSAVLSGIVIVLADQFFPLPRPTIPLAMAFGIGSVIALVGITFFTYYLRNFYSISLRARLVAALLFVTLLSTAILGTINLRALQTNLTQRAEDQLQTTAAQSAAEVDNFIQTNLDILRIEAQNPDLAEFLVRPSPDLRQELKTLLVTLSRRDQVNIISYSLFDSNGINLIDSRGEEEGQSIADRPYFQRVLQTGLPVISEIYYQDHVFYFAAPVRDNERQIIGVLRIEYNAAVLQQIIVKYNDLNGTGSFAILLDENRFILANGRYPEVIFHSLAPLEGQTLTLLQRNSQLPPGSPEQFSTGLIELEKGLQSGATLFTLKESSPDEIANVESTSDTVAVARLNTQPWQVAYSLEQDVLLAPVRQQVRTTALFTFLVGLLAAVVAVRLSQTLTAPILRLSEAARRVEAGDLQARADIVSNDEIGALAQVFNSMTARLSDLIGSLEQRVADRTADLKNAVLTSEKRARDLQFISEISRIISAEQQLDILLPLITRLISERFDFYHAGIFFVDETRRFARLQAANSEGGQKMLARGHQLEIGTGLVGTVMQTGKPRIALDVGTDAVFFNNPDLPNTRSEMALPLNYRGDTIGVLDVQSTQPNAFTESDANTLSILADQIAIAIQNARLFRQMQQAREEAEALYTQIQSQEWNTFIRQETRIGYQHTPSGGKHLTQPVLSNEIRKALKKGLVVVEEGENAQSQPAIVVPVKLRGQTIGVLNIKAPLPNRRWSQDEINLAQTISDRLALAIDNARLLLESQRRAAKEAKIGEVSAKIGASINLQNVLQTAVEELGRALPGSEVIIQFGDTDGESIE